MNTLSSPAPALVPLSPETDAPRAVQIVMLFWTPDIVEDEDYVADCEPVLLVVVRERTITI